MGTKPLGGEPRTFQINPCDHAAPDFLGQHPDLPYQIGCAGGDQRSNQGGGAVPKVQSSCGGRVGRGRGGEIRPSPAMHMRVDEPRHYIPKVAICGTRRRPRPSRLHRDARNFNPTRPQQFPSGEEGVSDHQHQMPCQSGLES